MLFGFIYFKQEIIICFSKAEVESFEQDLGNVSIIFNRNLKTKKQIEDKLSKNEFSPFLEKKVDTLIMNKTKLVFENDTLVEIIKKY